MNNQPLVSIIMNCYNGAKYLEDSLQSIVNQTYQNWELIFWDNVSFDNSKKIFEKFRDKRFKYYLASKHEPLYRARNLAIKKANGEFISFLDTDDIWLNDKLTKQIKLFSNKNIGLVYGNYWRYNPLRFFEKKRLAYSKKLPSGKITEILLREYFIGIISVILRKQFLDINRDIFNVEFNMLSDMDFVLRFSKKYEFDCVQEPVAIYRQHENQLQIRNLRNHSKQMINWYEKIKLSKEFGSEKNLRFIKNRCDFYEITQSINDKLYVESLKKIIFYPNNINKIKLLLMLFVPKKILNRIISLT